MDYKVSQTNVSAALDKHLEEMPGRPAVAWEDVIFEQTDELYYEQTILPVEPTSVGIESGGTDVLAGIYQIMINAPKGLGKASYLVEVEKIKARFARSQVLTFDGTRVVLQKVWSNSAVPDATFYKIPVSIRYRGI
jgi:hypothetical protein